MFKRNKNDKGKKSQEARMNISRSLRGKARNIRKKASTAARKDIIKGAGAAGYATGRVGTEIAARPRVAKAVGNVGSKVANAANRIGVTKAAGTVASKIPGPKPTLRNQVTATRATGAFMGGSVKGAAAGLSAAEKRQKKQKGM